MVTNIKYINQSMNKNLPQVFVFSKNEIPSFDSVADGIAWKVIKNIGRGSISKFQYFDNYTVRAAWNNGLDTTAELNAKIGFRYTVTLNKTGIVLEKDGNASYDDCIEIVNKVNVKNGILAQLSNNGNVLIGKKIVAYDQIASFVPSKTLFWGLASEIIEGKGIKSAVLNSTNFFELNIRGLSEVIVSLNGNAENGYYFQVENQI